MKTMIIRHLFPACLLLFLPFTAFPQWVKVHDLGDSDFAYFYDTKTGFIMDYDYLAMSLVRFSLHRTQDCGQHFDLLFSADNDGLDNLHFINATTGYASRISKPSGTHEFHLMETTDGGTSWHMLAQSDQWITSLCFTRPQYGYYIDAWYNLYHYENQQSTLIYESNGISLGEMQFVDDSTAYLTAYNDTSYKSLLLKTMDYGKTWNTMLNETSYDFLSISFPSANDGFIGINDGKVLRTTDGGTGWSILSSGQDEDIIDIDFIDPYRGYAITKNAVLHTSDGGISWSLEMTGDSTMENIFYHHDGRAHAVSWQHIYFSDEDYLLQGDPPPMIAAAYPNPFISGFTLKFESTATGDFLLRLMDISGKLVREQNKTAEGNLSLDIEFPGIAPGMYFLRVDFNGQFLQAMKLIKQ